MIGKPALIIIRLLCSLAYIFYCNCHCVCSEDHSLIPQYYNHHIPNAHHWKPIIYQPKYHSPPHFFEHMQTGIKEPLKELKLESKPIMTMTQPKLPEKKEEIKPVKEDEKSVEKSLKHFMSENFKPFKQDIKEMKEKTEEKPEKKSEQNISKDSKNHDKEDESKEDEKHHHQHHDKNAYYKFEYSVNDKKTKDVKHQKEELHGDKIVGEYSLLEEDGNVRTVKYTADWKNGFRAQIHNSKKM